MSIFLMDPSTQKKKKNNPTKDNSSTIKITGEKNSQTCKVVCLNQFWPKTIEEIRNIETINFKTRAIPLNRIKTVMKLDENVQKVDIESTIIISKAVEIFIKEITLHGWMHANGHRRRTLLKKDISMTIPMHNQFDFLIDIVPRVKAIKETNKMEVKTSTNPKQGQYYYDNAKKKNTNNASSAGQIIQIVQPTISQIVSLRNVTQNQVSNITSNIITTSTTTTMTVSQIKTMQLQCNTQVAS